MRTSTLRRYTCSNSSSGELGGRPRDRALAATGRSCLVSALASVLMSLVAVLASGCDIARDGSGEIDTRGAGQGAAMESGAVAATVASRPASHAIRSLARL